MLENGPSKKAHKEVYDPQKKILNRFSVQLPKRKSRFTTFGWFRVIFPIFLGKLTKGKSGKFSGLGVRNWQWLAVLSRQLFDIACSESLDIFRGFPSEGTSGICGLLICPLPELGRSQRPLESHKIWGLGLRCRPTSQNRNRNDLKSQWNRAIWNRRALCKMAAKSPKSVER